MDLPELQLHWDTFGREDPLWAVLTDPAKRHGRWNRDEFFESGRQEVDRSLTHLAALGAHPVPGRALDFGCGPGRASQALCRHFDHVDGIDIAPSMIELARRWNRFGDRCTYHVNDQSDLGLFPDGTFDFAYSLHVLQHMEPRFATAYIAEFCRCLRPGGVAFFQVVSAVKQGEGRPLPRDGFRARLELAAPLPTFAAGHRAGVEVRIRNEGTAAWPAAGVDGWYLVTLANRWRRGRRLHVPDDARCFLPHDLEPGEEAVLVLSVEAPHDPGRYVLELDMVQEGISWFQDQKSTPLRLGVEVARPSAPPDGAVTRDGAAVAARMEMHVITVDECQKAATSAGGELVDATPLVEIFGGQEFDFVRSCLTVRRRN